jgi:hypothetical protein
MEKSLIAAALLALCAWSGAASAARLGVLVPVQQGAEVATRPGPGGAPRPILRPASDGSLYRAAGGVAARRSGVRPET